MKRKSVMNEVGLVLLPFLVGSVEGLFLYTARG